MMESDITLVIHGLCAWRLGIHRLWKHEKHWTEVLGLTARCGAAPCTLLATALISEGYTLCAQPRRGGYSARGFATLAVPVAPTRTVRSGSFAGVAWAHVPSGSRSPARCARILRSSRARRPRRFRAGARHAALRMCCTAAAASRRNHARLRQGRRVHARCPTDPARRWGRVGERAGRIKEPPASHPDPPFRAPARRRRRSRAGHDAGVSPFSTRVFAGLAAARRAYSRTSNRRPLGVRAISQVGARRRDRGGGLVSP